MSSSSRRASKPSGSFSHVAHPAITLAALAAMAFGGLSHSLSAVLLAQSQPSVQPNVQPGEKKAGALPAFAEVIGDMKPTTAGGLFTFYTFDGTDPSKDATKILAQIPKALLGKDMMLATGISRGSSMGMPAGTDLVRFEVSGNRLLISLPDVRQKQSKDRAITGAVEATYTSGYLAILPIITRADSGDPVVDFTSFFAQAGRFAGLGDVDPRRGGLVRYSAIKSFPQNVLVQVEVLTAGPTGGGTVGVGYSFRLLPDLARQSYKPRVADERVGYFTTVRQDWNAGYNERENLVRYINRWNLQKKDPTLELSPPVEPIVFIIEKTVPLQWRRFVREGIEEWNKAYEAVGITGAIVVYQQTDDNEFKDIDPEDARYNFFRWIVTGRGFAMGPSRPDPRTGEILDADIIFDDSMVRFYQQDLTNLLGPQALATLYGPGVISFLEQNPKFIPTGMTLADVQETASEMRRHASIGAGNSLAENTELLTDSGDAVPAPSSLARFSSNTNPLSNPQACTYAQGLQQQMYMLGMMATQAAAVPAAERKVPERLIGQMVKDITSHEVGHTVGLRHNFIASTWLSPDEIKTRRDAGNNEATFASTMDYNALLLFPGDKIETVKAITSPVIGPYDMWAIEYGYKSPGAGENEAGLLSKIAQRSNEPGLAFSTDEDVNGFSSPDPRSNRWDMSSDPIAWAQGQAKLADEMLATFDQWAVGKDEPQHFLRGAFLSLMSDKVRSFAYVSRIIGGQEFNRNRAGDPNAKAPLTLVPAAKQREALEVLAASVFNDEFIKVTPELLNRLTVPRNYDEGFASPASRIDFPVHQTMLSLQTAALMPLVSPQVLQRVYDAELKTAVDDKFTAAELISHTRSMIWGNLKLAEGAAFTDAKPMISSTRRNLQKQWLKSMLALAGGAPSGGMSADLQNMIRYSLRDVSTTIADLMKDGKGKLDLATLAHLSETKSQIDRTLDAPAISVEMSLPFLMMGNESQK